MFNNKFTKTDNLVESIRKVMIENDIRRQVELTLNEQLGIQSKKQLPHELHEDYDAKLDQAVKTALDEACSYSDKKMEEEAEEIDENLGPVGRVAAAGLAAGALAGGAAGLASRPSAKPMAGTSYTNQQRAGMNNLATRVAQPSLVKKPITTSTVASPRTVKEEATEAQKAKIKKVMHKWKQGKEHIGKSSETVPVSKKGQKQAVAIALSQAGLSKNK